MKKLIAITLGVALAGVGTIAIAARNSSGTYSLPGATNPVTAGSTITTAWANGTMADLAAEITASLDRSGRGGMLAPIRTTDGTSAAPAHSFTAETGMGFYRSASGTMSAAVGGGNPAGWTSTAATFPLEVTLTKAGDQAITKSGTGNLTVYNSVAGGNVILTGGAGGYVVAGSNVAMGNMLITSLQDPVSAQDAATKAYVDGSCLAANTTTVGNVYTDTGLSVGLVGSATYQLTLQASAKAATSAIGGALFMGVYSGTSANHVFIGLQAGGSTTNSDLFDVAGMATVVSTTVSRPIEIRGLFRTTTAGTLKIQFTYPSGTGFVEAGSCLSLRRIL
jgi:hypothetical protein